TVALIGRSNVGKSTLLNAVLDEDLAIVSPLPQTTRDTLLGVVTLEEAQIAFIDTPGLHRPKSELGRRMNNAALEAARTTDAVVMMTAVAEGGPSPKPRHRRTPAEPERHPGTPGREQGRPGARQVAAAAALGRAQQAARVERRGPD